METITQIIDWFALVYIGIPLLSFFILVIYSLFGGKISKEYLDKIIEFSKWYIVSVAVVFAAKVIETSFSERETGIKEMQLYDKYVSTILEANNIESRWKLAEYFSTVTPTDRLRERWIAYKNTIEADYRQFKTLAAKEDSLLSKDSLTAIQIKDLNKVQREKSTYEGKLVENKIGRWVIVFTADTDLEQSKFEWNKLIKAGIDNPKIYLRNNSYRTISKIFLTRQEALDYLNANMGKLRPDAYIVNLNNWCPNEEFNSKENYYECK